MKKTPFVQLARLLLLVSLAQCASKDDYTDPEVLIVGMSVSEDYDKTAGKVNALQQYLTKTLDRKIRIYKMTNGSATIEAIKAQKIHMGSTGAFSYIMARQHAEIMPLVTTAAASPDTIHKYWSTLIVPPDSPIQTVEDLKDQKSDLSLTWAYPTSTSGHLIPRSFLKTQGILPEDFKDVMVSESHIASLYACITGKVDLAAVNNVTTKEYLRRGKISTEDFRVIWRSNPIPRGCIFASRLLNPELIARLRKTLVALYETDPEVARKIHYNYDYDVQYVAVDDTYYDSLEQQARWIGVIQ